MNSTLQLANGSLMPNYGEMLLEIISGKGAYVWTRDAQGKRKRCLDLLCGLGVNSLGHCHPDVVAAIAKQSKKLMHVSNLYGTSPMAELAQKLVELTGDVNANVFFCNSGTEANEAAGKLARLWAYEVHGPQKNKIVALKGGFHGRTLLSITMTGQDKMQKKFTPGETFVELVEFNNIKDLRKVIDHDVCAVIYETIQAEGGVNVMHSDFSEEIVNLSEEYQFLGICDEVQTGVGRTGDFFSFDSLGFAKPDIITLAKALGGGLPIGAMIATCGIGDYLVPGSHAATFGGNPVVCAAALAVLKVIEKEDLLSSMNSLDDYIKLYLHSLKQRHNDKIKEVRGKGMMIGVELFDGFSAGDVVKQMYEKGVLIGTAGPQVVRFLPPLNVTEEQLDKALIKFAQVIKNL